jgi:hypothetical protein
VMGRILMLSIQNIQSKMGNSCEQSTARTVVLAFSWQFTAIGCPVVDAVIPTLRKKKNDYSIAEIEPLFMMR